MCWLAFMLGDFWCLPPYNLSFYLCPEALRDFPCTTINRCRGRKESGGTCLTCYSLIDPWVETLCSQGRWQRSRESQIFLSHHPGHWHWWQQQTLSSNYTLWKALLIFMGLHLLPLMSSDSPFNIRWNYLVFLDSQCLCHEPYRRKCHNLKTHRNQRGSRVALMH